MGKRIRLGLIFDFNESWIGGLYYILNLISALGKIPAEDQPFITILSENKEDFVTAKKTGYKYINYRNPYRFKRSPAEAIVNKIGHFILQHDLIDKRISDKNIDVIFPATNHACFSRVSRKVYWFPDFQHIHFAGLFSGDEIKRREIILTQIAESSKDLILSSESSKNDWNSLKFSTTTKTHTLPFAVSHPAYDVLDINELLKEFGIRKEYFIISNQFWKHKNHLLVLQSILLLRGEALNFQFVFTGKLDAPEVQDYISSIKNFINENNLGNNVKMLGLIDRKKQLKLMKHAKAIIQPSLFEGWSTVIEDAKAMGKPVIVSDIPVHREQLHESCYFFDPYNGSDLAEKISLCVMNQVNTSSINYDEHVAAFGKKFYRVIRDLKSKTSF